MNLQMKREALKKLNRKANEGDPGVDTERPNDGFCHGFATVEAVLARFGQAGQFRKFKKWFKIRRSPLLGA